ncbi:MAG: RHS repeat-associated core domain-containing protein [Candidatus Micrarchaeota archaeon]
MITRGKLAFSECDARFTSDSRLQALFQSQFNDAIANIPDPNDDGEPYEWIHNSPFRHTRVEKSENYTTPNSTIPFSNISYDPLSRIIKTTNPDNTTKTFNYSKWNTTITDENGNQLLQIQDAYGQIIEIHEFNSPTPYVTKYSYDAASQLLNITDNENNKFKFTYDTLGRKTSLSDPDLGIWNYSYDAASNLISQKDNRSITTALQYDPLNRLTHKSASPLAFTYLYDEQLNGTLSRILSASFAEAFSYDSRYRKTSELKSIENNVSRTNYTYDSLDRITAIILPNSETIYYTYSSQNQLSSIEGILTLAQYDAFNKPILRNYANSLNTSFTYDFPTSRLTRIQTSSLQDLQYLYDNTSNILQINDAYNSIIQTMGYDKLSRLTFASRTDNSPQKENYLLNYTYSSIGNILSIQENNANTISTYNYQNSPVHSPKSISQTGPLLELKDLQLVNTNSTLKTYRFKIKNNGNANITNVNFTFFTGVSQINSTLNISLKPQESILIFISYNYSNSTEYKVTARASNQTFLSQQSLAIGQTSAPAPSNLTQTFLYDANGNLIQDANNYYEYNSFNQLSAIRTGNSTGFIISEYLYDPDGNRIRKTDHLKNETILYINQNFLRVINATGTFDTIYYFADSQMIARKDPDGKKYFYHPDHLGSTTLVTNESGAVVEDTNYKPFGEPLYDAKSRFLYTGKEKDSETGLMYYGARYYNPKIGKFTQADSMIPDLYNPQMLNRYSYVLNNPYVYIDLKGNFGIKVGLSLTYGLGVFINPIQGFLSKTVSLGGFNSYSAGYVLVIGNKGSIEIGKYISKTDGFMLGGEISGNLDASLLKDAQSLDDIEGFSNVMGVNAKDIFGVSNQISTDKNGNEEVGYSIGAGFGISAVQGKSETVITDTFVAINKQKTNPQELGRKNAYLNIETNPSGSYVQNSGQPYNSQPFTSLNLNNYPEISQVAYSTSDSTVRSRSPYAFYYDFYSDNN